MHERPVAAVLPVRLRHPVGFGVGGGADVAGRARVDVEGIPELLLQFGEELVGIEPRAEGAEGFGLHDRGPNVIDHVVDLRNLERGGVVAAAERPEPVVRLPLDVGENVAEDAEVGSVGKHQWSSLSKIVWMTAGQ